MRAVTLDSTPQQAAAASRAKRAEEEAAKCRLEAERLREERDAARQQEELARGEAARAAEGFASHQRDKHMLGRAVQLLQEEKLDLTL